MGSGRAKIGVLVVLASILAAPAGCGAGEDSAKQSEREALKEAISGVAARTIRIDTESHDGSDASIVRRFRRLASAVDRDLLELELASESFRSELNMRILEDQVRRYRADLRAVAIAARIHETDSGRRAFSALRGDGFDLRVYGLGLQKSLSAKG